MPSAQGVSGTVEGAESADASVGTSVPGLLESIHIGRIRNGGGETGGVNPRLEVAGGRSSLKVAHAAVGRFFFVFELPDLVSKEPKLLFHSFLAHRAAHRGGMRADQRKRHGGGDDIGESGGARPGGVIGVGGGGHEGSGLFVKVGRIILIISRVM